MNLEINNGLLLFIFNSLFWIGFSFLIGFICHLIPFSFYSPKNPIFKERFWEFGGKLYEFLFFVRLWKDKVPEAGELIKINPFNKKKLASRELSYLERFVVETSRAELVHILVLLITPLSYPFNPPIGDYIMTAYGVLANVPCIIIQRYNRIRLLRLLKKISRGSAIRRIKS